MGSGTAVVAVPSPQSFSWPKPAKVVHVDVRIRLPTFGSVCPEGPPGKRLRQQLELLHSSTFHGLLTAPPPWDFMAVPWKCPDRRHKSSR